MILDTNKIIDASGRSKLTHKLLLHDLMILVILEEHSKPMASNAFTVWLDGSENYGFQRTNHLVKLGLVDRLPRNGKSYNQNVISAKGKALLASFRATTR